jgi:hypothetical protein
MTRENKEIIVKDYLTNLFHYENRIIINEIDDFSDHPLRPWVNVFYSVIKTENKIHTKKDLVWSGYGTFNSLFVSEVRDQKLKDLGI